MPFLLGTAKADTVPSISQRQGPAFDRVELHEFSVSPFLQLVKSPLNSSSALQGDESNESFTHLGFNPRLGVGMFPLAVQLVNGEAKIY